VHSLKYDGRDLPMPDEPAIDIGQELMLRVSRGDDRAFEALVERFQQKVVNIVYRYLGQADGAEDLAQEVFLRIYRARAGYKPLARFETWLGRIIYNVVVNAAQSRKRSKTQSLDAMKAKGWQEETDPSQGPAVMDPLARLERRELREKVREAVLALPDQQRMALILNKYQGLSYEEIARSLEMSVEAVKSLLYRAREKIRAALSRYVGTEVSNEKRL